MVPSRKTKPNIIAVRGNTFTSQLKAANPNFSWEKILFFCEWEKKNSAYLHMSTTLTLQHFYEMEFFIVILRKEN